MNEGVMEEGVVLLFYNYVDIPDPHEVLAWQKELCGSLQLKGKIRVAKEGINITLGGTSKRYGADFLREATEKYKEALLAHPLFKDTVIKESYGTNVFTSLAARVVPEACPIGLPEGVAPASECSTHLTPDEVHQLLSAPPEDLVILDTRNYYGAILPNIRKFSYFPKYVIENKELFENKKVFMYCTGGVRCERASSYLQNLGICSEVYQLEGGIHCYGEKYPDGYFRGKNYVFDDRIAMTINDKTVSTCNWCDNSCDNYSKCSRDSCFIVSLSCPTCKEAHGGNVFCCPGCRDFHQNPEYSNEQVKKRKFVCLCQTERTKFSTVEEYYKELKRKACK